MPSDPLVLHPCLFSLSSSVLGACLLDPVPDFLLFFFLYGVPPSLDSCNDPILFAAAIAILRDRQLPHPPTTQLRSCHCCFLLVLCPVITLAKTHSKHTLSSSQSVSVAQHHHNGYQRDEFHVAFGPRQVWRRRRSSPARVCLRKDSPGQWMDHFLHCPRHLCRVRSKYVESISSLLPIQMLTTGNLS